MGLIICQAGYFTAFLYLLAFPAAYIYAALCEWVLHKHVLHGLGKKKNSWFSFHWHDHHKNCRKYAGMDLHYARKPKHKTIWKEIISLLALTVIHSPLIFVAPVFYVLLLLFMIRYFYIHKKSHLNTKWAKQNVPWHWDHHMGKNQDANWGVTTDMWDLIMKTRIKHLEELKR